MVLTDELRDVLPRYHSSIEKSDGCWLWSGPTDKDGYGRFNIKKKRFGAHRIAYLLKHGELPDDLVVRHDCDTPLCVNPSHLSVGTVQDNVDDRNSRARTAKGTENGRSVLQPHQIVEIRRRHEAGEGQRPLAREYNVHPTTIRDIVRRKIWKDI